jgi:hypothetical protein
MFHTGLFSPADWRSADFITGFNVYRKAFSLSQTVSNVHSAKLFICGFGYFEASINGQKIGDHVLDPAGTKYEKRLLYVTFDVKSYAIFKPRFRTFHKFDRDFFACPACWKMVKMLLVYCLEVVGIRRWTRMSLEANLSHSSRSSIDLARSRASLLMAHGMLHKDG